MCSINISVSVFAKRVCKWQGRWCLRAAGRGHLFIQGSLVLGQGHVGSAYPGHWNHVVVTQGTVAQGGIAAWGCCCSPHSLRRLPHSPGCTVWLISVNLGLVCRVCWKYIQLVHVQLGSDCLTTLYSPASFFIIVSRFSCFCIPTKTTHHCVLCCLGCLSFFIFAFCPLHFTCSSTSTEYLLPDACWIFFFFFTHFSVSKCTGLFLVPEYLASS